MNTISAGPLASRAASAIGIIEKMVEYVAANAPLTEKLTAEEVGRVAAFLSSSLASGITGNTVYVDKGYHAMGMAVPPARFDEIGRRFRGIRGFYFKGSIVKSVQS